jgi:hypothetical protein
MGNGGSIALCGEFHRVDGNLEVGATRIGIPSRFWINCLWNHFGFAAHTS